MKLTILGGGLSAISLACFLQNREDIAEINILEKEDRAGGLCRTFETNGIEYDVGPHIIFSKDKEILDFMNGLLEDNIAQIRRSNRILHQKRFEQYPFENDLSKLPEQDKNYCVNAFLHNPYENYDAQNMLQFFLKTFGEGITNTYLRPYNEKIWKYDPSFMDTQMVDRIPKPPKEDILRSAAGETVEGYCSDHTRTYPVSGRFTQKQKDIYNIVLAAHDHVARIVKPHMMYTEVHNAAYMTLAEGLVGLGLLKGPAADAVAAGAMTMLMPHGLGHGLGMDVHDCEAMGERSFDYGSIAERAAESGTCVYRAAWRIEPGTVMTDEPGLYFIPALIDKCRAEGKYKGIVDYDALEAYRDFGGIRIEDDILVTESGSRIIGDRKIPVTVEELEGLKSLF